MGASTLEMAATADSVTDGDADIARRSREDPVAFGALYERYHRRIYWYLRARTPSEQDAADLTQQVFTQALANIGRFRPRRASFSTWLFTIARNSAVDHHRTDPARSTDQSPPPWR